MLACLLALVGQMALPPLSPAEPLDGLPEWLAGRWKTTEIEQRNWIEPGFDDVKWISPKLIPMVNNGVVVDHKGGQWPEAPGIQFAFQHFWHPYATQDNRRTFYRRGFFVPGNYAGCSTYLSVDDTYELFVNGKLVSSGADLVMRTKEFPIRELLRPGRNAIGIVARNTGASKGVRCWTDLHLSYPSRPGGAIPWTCSRQLEARWSEPFLDTVRQSFGRPAATPKWRTPALLRENEAVRTSIASSPMWIDRNFGPQEVVYFRMPLYLDGVPNWGSLRISADNGYEVWVNGKMLGQYRGEKPDVVADVDISSVLHHGWNMIGVKALNFGGPASLTVLPTIKVSL